MPTPVLVFVPGTIGSELFDAQGRVWPGSLLEALTKFDNQKFQRLLAPNLKPGRLVVHPTANYFWLSCETATENLQARRALPAESRELVRVYSCLHRRRRAPSSRS